MQSQVNPQAAAADSAAATMLTAPYGVPEVTAFESAMWATASLSPASSPWLAAWLREEA